MSLAREFEEVDKGCAKPLLPVIVEKGASVVFLSDRFDSYWRYFMVKVDSVLFWGNTDCQTGSEKPGLLWVHPWTVDVHLYTDPLSDGRQAAP